MHLGTDGRVWLASGVSRNETTGPIEYVPPDPDYNRAAITEFTEDLLLPCPYYFVG
jgi:hypothetical protein